MTTHATACADPLADPERHCAGPATTVYRIYTDPGNGWLLLYVGISSSWQRRLVQHERNQPWAEFIQRVDVDHWCCERHARAEEQRAILTERPAHNKQGNPHNAGIYA